MILSSIGAQYTSFTCRCGLVVKIPDFGWRDPGSIPGNDTAFLCERSPNLG